MIRNVIFAGNSAEEAIRINVISNDRGETGEQGPQGDPGVSIVRLYKQANHLYMELSDGSVIDAGALPFEDLTIQYVGEMDGVNQTYSVSPEIDPYKVKFVLINGVVYTDGYTLSSNSITFAFDAGLIPSGRLEIVFAEESA